MATDPHEIEVTIDADGSVEFHVEGMKGKGCLTVLKDFERALGVAKASPKATPEMHEVAKTGAGAQKVKR